MKFSIDVVEQGEIHPIRTEVEHHEMMAVQTAVELVEEYPDCSVFVRFYIQERGVSGFLNPGGYDMEAEDWKGFKREGGR